MNNTINTVSTNSGKISNANVLSNKNTNIEGPNAEHAADSSVKEESFHDLIHNKAEDSAQENDKTNSESSGNELPILKDSADAAAEDDRNLLIINSSFFAYLSDQNNQLTQSTDIDSNIENELNALTAQVRQLIKSDLDVDGQLEKGQQVLSSGYNVNTTNTANDKTIYQALDISQLNAEQLETLSLKGQVKPTVTNQQHMLPNIQTSLLLQTVSSQGEFSPETQPLMVTTTATNTPTINIPPTVQAEIVETFARPAWSQGMGKQILWMVQQNISSAEIRLNPANLGPIEVRIDMTDDKVNVSLTSSHAVVREAMELALPKLREMFDANGLNLAGTDISQHSFAEQREQKAAENNSKTFSDTTDQTILVNSNEQELKQSSPANGIVDLYI